MISPPDIKPPIKIIGARVNNLKNIVVDIPRNKLVVITGLSGSGKSSLAFDTLYADGQRRYVESLSSYARQFLGRIQKPDVDQILNISPAIAIEQRVNNRNPRSTVGTSTEIYEYLKLLYARIGKTYSPISGYQVKRDTVSDVSDFICGLGPGAKVLLYSPLFLPSDRSMEEQLQVLLQQGFSRVYMDGKIWDIEECMGNPSFTTQKKVFVLIDRLVVKPDAEDFKNRLSDSIQTAFYEGHGVCYLEEAGPNPKTHSFSDKFERDGIRFDEPSVNMFTFNNPFGACRKCEGYGSVIGIDPDLVIPDKSLSVYEGAVACWKGDKMSEWKDELVANAYKFDFPIHKAVSDFSPEEWELLWNGNKYFQGIHAFFEHVEEQTYKIQYRVLLSRYRGKTVCPDCRGARLRADAQYVKISGKSIVDLVLMPIEALSDFFRELDLSETDWVVGERLIKEIRNRLGYLLDVGLSYLTLNRLSSTLSGGESQRINLATSLGSALVGSMYILDEPSIGLHSRDTERLIAVLENLRDLGNTVIVVEHDEDIIRKADYIIDIGPLAGTGGGELVYQGTLRGLLQTSKSLTAQYLNQEKNLTPPAIRRPWNNYIRVLGATENNLKNLNISFPLNVLTAVTGVSGSGKSSLVKGILYPALQKLKGGYSDKSGKYLRLEGDLKLLEAVEMVDQNPIGRSSRSNPATYLKAFDDIRQLYADQKLSKTRGFKPGYFSFNIAGGRCDNCEGEGQIKIEMQFMADIYLTCDVCKGKRFKEEVLDVAYRGVNIHELLNMTIQQALDFFKAVPKPPASVKRIAAKLQPLVDVGLGYLGLGQSSSTLSGGEAQRVKLAYYLSKGDQERNTLFIFDEPTTGLHFHDIHNLLQAFNALIEQGHTIIVVEHNLDVIKMADWIIDLGPEAGDKGGEVVFEGRPEDMLKNYQTPTAKYLKHKIFT